MTFVYDTDNGIRLHNPALTIQARVEEISRLFSAGSLAEPIELELRLDEILYWLYSAGTDYRDAMIIGDLYDYEIAVRELSTKLQRAASASLRARSFLVDLRIPECMVHCIAFEPIVAVSEVINCLHELSSSFDEWADVVANIHDYNGPESWIVLVGYLFSHWSAVQDGSVSLEPDAVRAGHVGAAAIYFLQACLAPVYLDPTIRLPALPIETLRGYLADHVVATNLKH